MRRLFIDGGLRGDWIFYVPFVSELSIQSTVHRDRFYQAIRRLLAKARPANTGANNVRNMFFKDIARVHWRWKKSLWVERRFKLSTGAVQIRRSTKLKCASLTFPIRQRLRNRCCWFCSRTGWEFRVCRALGTPWHVNCWSCCGSCWGWADGGDSCMQLMVLESIHSVIRPTG